MVEANSLLLHSKAADASGSAGYQGVAERLDAKVDVIWQDAVLPGRRKAADLSSLHAAMIDKSLQILPGIRAKAKWPLLVIKCQFGFTKVHYCGLKENSAQVQTLFALSNLWTVQRKLMTSAA